MSQREMKMMNVVSVVAVPLAFATSSDHDELNQSRRHAADLSLGIVKFYVVADTPYGIRERGRFPQQLDRMELRPDFLVHLGNVRERQQDCFPPHLDQASKIILNHSRLTTFVLPGESDWYTCSTQASAWIDWKKIFTRFEDNWNHKFLVRHQTEASENFSFVFKRVLFISFHILNVSIVDTTAWDAMVKSNVRWLENELSSYGSSEEVGSIVLLAHAKPHPRRHRIFLESLMQNASRITKPILYLHGGTNAFSITPDFIAQNLSWVSLPKGGNEDPMEITVDPSQTNPFKIHRRPYILL